mmetsp:Transcript_39027/g.73184  ORF Transcript_39027/g.73184 Transcript_39027/m.73184 type:complete len:201 (-) Transcript_39027:128-730(-)
MLLGPPAPFMPKPPPSPLLARDERKAKIAKGMMFRARPMKFGWPGAPGLFSGGSTVKATSFFCNCFVNSVVSDGRMRASCLFPSLSMQRTCCPSAEKLTFSTSSFLTASRNCLVDHGVLFGSAAIAAFDRPTSPVSPAASAARRPGACMSAERDAVRLPVYFVPIACPLPAPATWKPLAGLPARSSDASFCDDGTGSVAV